MAKKKQIEDLNEADSYAEKLVKEIESDFGKGTVLKAQEVIDEKRMIIPFSPAIDLISGGVPEGSFVTLSGPPKCGKTTSALYFCATAQRPEYGNRNIWIGSVEGRLKKMNLTGIKGLDVDRVKVISSSIDKVLSAQDFVSIFEKILMTDIGCVLVIDSYSSLVSEKTLTEGVAVSTRGSEAQLLSRFMKNIGGIVPSHKSIVLGITHIINNTGNYGPSTFEKGGVGISYQCDLKLKCKKFEPWLVGNNPRPVGQLVTWKTEATALAYPPHQECKSYIRYGIGICEITEALNLGIECSLISAAGSWITCDFMKNHLHLLDAKEWNEETQKQCKFHGSERLRAKFESDPAWLEALNQSLKDLMG